MSTPTPTTAETEDARRALLWTGVTLGVGVIGTLDGVVLHELLQWHRLYVHTTEFWRTFIDGVFHLVTSALLFWGAMRLWSDPHLLSRAGRPRVLWAGMLFGMGGFNPYDGTIQHKVLKLHQIRPSDPNQLPYDVVFLAIAVAFVLLGLLMLRLAGRRRSRAGSSG